MISSTSHKLVKRKGRGQMTALALPTKSRSQDNRSQTSNKNNRGSQRKLKKLLWLIKDKGKHRVVNRTRRISKDRRAKINTIKLRM